jgi:hypothetical protein
MVYVTARRQVEALLASLKLPIDECGRRRTEGRAQWLATAGRPLEMHDILAE